MSKPVHTRPHFEGPRSNVDLSQAVQVDRRGGGVQVIDAPYTRPAAARRRAPHWERSGMGGGRSGHLYIPTPPPAEPGQASAVFVARTDPHWIQEPEGARSDSSPALPAEPEIRFASFGRRLLAWLIDAGTIGLASTLTVLVGLTFFGWSKVLPSLSGSFDEVLDGVIFGRQLWIFVLAMSVLLSFVYGTLSHGLLGMTYGQSLLHLRVETKDGEQPRLSDCAWRSGFGFLSVVLGGLGVAWALFDPKGLSLHDRIVGTRVVRTDPVVTETDVEDEAAEPPAGK